MRAAHSVQVNFWTEARVAGRKEDMDKMTKSSVPECENPLPNAVADLGGAGDGGVSIDYSVHWRRLSQEPNIPISADEAERRHNTGEQYVAFIKRNGVPYCFVETRKNVYNVEFFDDLMRSYVVYNFIDRAGRNCLFMCRAEHRVFSEDTPRTVKQTIYNFLEDGKLLIQERDYGEGGEMTSEAKVNVAGNWEVYPKFGQYGGLIEIERRSAESGGCE